MKKIYCVTGPKGSGKSTAVARFPRPSELHRMVIVDTEDSMSNILENNAKMGVEFGSYIRMYDRLSKGARGSILESMAQGKLPWVDEAVKASALISFYQYFMDEVSSVLKKGDKDGKPFRFLGIDTIEPLEAGVRAYTEHNRRKAGWSGQWAYGKPEVEGVRPILEGIFEGISQLGIEYIIIASHLKPVWEGEGDKVRKVINKVKVGGRIVVWSRISSQMWWLMSGVGNPDGAPAALRLKARYGHEEIDKANDEWIGREMLPPRIPHFTWKDVRHYQEHGWNPASPQPGELPTKEEMRMMSEFLTDEQLKLMVIGAQVNLLEKQQAAGGLLIKPKPVNVVADANRERVTELAAAGKTNAEIVKETGLALPQIIKMRKTL